MSAEAGGGILGFFLLLALAGPILSAALAVVAVGAVVFGAVAAATAVARGVNAASRAAHRRAVQASIDRTANRELVQQRQQMLDMYEQQSAALEQISLEQNRRQEDIVLQARNNNAASHRELRALQERSRGLMVETSQQLNQSITRLNADVSAQLTTLSDSVTRQVSQRRNAIDQKLRTLSNQPDKDRAALADVTHMMNETLALYEQLMREPEATSLIAPQMEKLHRLQKDSSDLIQKCQGQAALATVSAFTQQTMEAFHHLDMARHRRQLLKENLELRTAALKAMVEHGHTIQCDGVKGLPAETDYWVNGELKPIYARAQKLLVETQMEGSMLIADYEKLLMEIDHCTQEMDKTMNKARQAYVCAVLRIQMLRKAQKGFAATGWKASKFGFIDGDFRKPAVMRFAHGAGKADLILSAVYDEPKAEYSVDVKIERYDTGVIDEGLRHAQHKQLSDALQAEGIPVTISCTETTAGRNAILETKEFSNPSNQ